LKRTQLALRGGAKDAREARLRMPGAAGRDQDERMRARRLATGMDPKGRDRGKGAGSRSESMLSKARFGVVPGVRSNQQWRRAKNTSLDTKGIDLGTAAAKLKARIRPKSKRRRQAESDRKR